MMLGLLVAVELPLRHAYLLELVGDRQDLPNAIAVTSLMANCGRLVGPTLAGLAIGWFSEAFCFLVNALSFVAVIVSFMFIRVTPQARASSHPPVIEGLREGLRYAWRCVPIRLLLMLLMLMGLLASPYASLMPALVRSVFQGDSGLMGYFMAASGAGGVIGTLYLAARPSVRGLLRVLAAASCAAGTALALLAWSHTVWLALPLLMLIGFGMLVTSVSVNMILQTIVEDDKRGRIMSLYTAAFLGMSPFGSLVAGAAADRIGIAATLTAGGVCCALAAAYTYSRRREMRAYMRPIYDRLGIARRKAAAQDIHGPST
jgi:predicted MFS family arabinose efflux permease